MATVKKTAAAEAAAQEVKSEEEIKNEILTGIIDPDMRTYTMNKAIEYGGAKREGTFKFRYPTLADRLKQGVLQSKLLNGQSIEALDIVTYNLAYAMSYLMTLAVQTPQCFHFEDMELVDELMEMFREVSEFVDSFRKDAQSGADAESGKDAAGKKVVANS